MESAEVEFTPQALRTIANMAKERDTGARGLRSIVEEVMTDVMFELPDIEAKGKFVVNEAVVRKEKPLFEKKTADKKSA
jgi:ATP-dependent Clp protease ATP-binding subunit ClpX